MKTYRVLSFDSKLNSLLLIDNNNFVINGAYYLDPINENSFRISQRHIKEIGQDWYEKAPIAEFIGFVKSNSQDYNVILNKFRKENLEENEDEKFDDQTVDQILKDLNL